MAWLHKLFAGYSGPPHISEKNTADEKSRRIVTLADLERTAYQWLFDGYSEGWTTETMGLEPRDAKKLYAGIYRKLGVTGSRELVQYYAPQEVGFLKHTQPDAEDHKMA